jgi:hypothetical protein
LKHNENLSLIQKFLPPKAVTLLLPDMRADLLLLTFGQKVLDIGGFAGFNLQGADLTK